MNLGYLFHTYDIFKRRLRHTQKLKNAQYLKRNYKNLNIYPKRINAKYVEKLHFNNKPNASGNDFYFYTGELSG